MPREFILQIMFLNARKVAIKAVDDYMIGKEEPMYCGFANVSIHPAKGKFVSFMKKANIGDTYKGYRISYYDIMPTDHQYADTLSLWTSKRSPQRLSEMNLENTV